MYPDSSAAEVASSTVVVAVLGAVAICIDGEPVPLTGARARNLLAALAISPGRSCSAQSLIGQVWGEQPPKSPLNALHTQVSRLRAVLPAGTLVAGPAGYRLTLGKDQVDLTLARQLDQRARQLHADGDHHGSLREIARARALWRGEPGTDLSAEELAAELADLSAARLAGLELTEIAARSTLGDFAGALEPARRRAERAPLDEQAQLSLMRVLAGLDRGTEALEVFARIRARLSDELGADPGGALVTLNTQILRGAGVSRPLAAAPAIGLRAAPNALLGRETELDELNALLVRSRVTTILGPGGSGKTRIANEIGVQLAGQTQVVLVELASVRSGEDVLAAITATLGISETEVKPAVLGFAATPRAEVRLRETLAGRRMLLILDNCEQVIDAVAATVADLIGEFGELTVLATSRAPLMIVAESAYLLPPLPIDEDGSPATDLFAARARAARPGVMLDSAEVAQLCRTLDGLPLAIELAAARVRTLSVAEINSRLGQRFALLRGGDPTSPARHRTLHAVIDWSWNLLDAQQQAVLRRMCRFPAGFTFGAATVVAGWGTVDDVDAALAGLVNQSLLRVTEDSETGLRYRMLEMVREFGEEQLSRAAEEEPVWERMCLWAREFATGVAVEFQSVRQLAAVRRCAADLDNLVLVLRRVTTPGSLQPVTAYTVYPVLGFHWAMRGLHSEVLKWAPRILSIPARQLTPDQIHGDYLLASYALAGLHIAMTGDLRPAMRARSLVRELLYARTELTDRGRMYGKLLCSRSDGRGVAALLREGARSPDQLTSSAALMIRANIRENTGDLRGSLRDALRCKAICVARGDVWGLASVYQHLGSVYGQSGDYPESVRYYRLGAQELHRLGAAEERATVSCFLTASLIGAGELDGAATVLATLAGPQESSAANTPLREGSQQIAAQWASRGELALAKGEIAAGLDYFGRALAAMDWPRQGAVPGPYEVLLSSAALGACVLHGELSLGAELARQVASYVSIRLRRYRDFPQIGTAAMAVGSHLIAAGNEHVGLELFSLAQVLRARQDYPSLSWDRHCGQAQAIADPDRVAAASAHARGVPRKAAAQRVLALFERM